MDDRGADGLNGKLVDALPQPALLADESGAIISANGLAASLLGHGNGSLLGLALTDLLPGVNGARTAISYARHADGSETPVEVTMATIAGPPSDLRLAIVHDVSERMKVDAELRLTRDRLAEAQRLARLGSWEWDIPKNDVLWSDELFRIYGLEPGETEPSYDEFLARVHPEDRDSVDERNRKAFADHEPFEDVKRCIRPDGTEFLMRTQGEVVADDEGNPLRMLGVCEDVTAERMAAEAQARLASIVRHSGDAIVLTTPKGVIESWNPAAEALYGYSAEEAAGKHYEFLVPADRIEQEEEVRERVIGGEHVEHYETRRARKDGAVIDVSLTRSLVRDMDGNLIGISTVARDVTERKRFEAQLTQLANQDPLTRLFNRNRFEEELTQRVAHVERYGGHGALLLLDLDNFKYVNDAYGHRAGDELLRSIGDLLRRRMRATDVVARLGGDEFAVLLPISETDRAGEVAEDLLRELRELTLPIDGQPIRITSSIGVTMFGKASGSAEELLAAADRAMYAAKDAGRDRAVFHDEAAQLEARSGRRQGWDHRIRKALDEDLFVLYSQPILDLAAGEVSQHEVLIRMCEGEEIVPPGAFLGVAERLGLIHAIDRWVVAEAIRTLSQCPELRLEVNLSARSVGERQILDMIRWELGNADVDPSHLILEITETAAIASIDQAREFADALQAIGCRFALDDFGAGFGSFYYLKHFPAEYLKIDGEFIRGPRSRTDTLIVESMVRIAGELGKLTIAEFVEDEACLTAVKEHGVDYAQGFHIGHPAPLAELVAAQ